MSDERVVIHVDMDAFFAAIEQRDDPRLRDRPVVVGADPKGGEGRGVVSTCSYEARRYGIHSAQPISQAYRLCPEAVFLPVAMKRYGRESRRVRELLAEFTPRLQFISIDEAFLDVTGSLRLFGGKRRIAERIQGRIEEETGLSASLGVAPNKLVAKIASDLEKPRGLVIVEPAEVCGFLAPLEVRRLPSVGPRMEQSLRRLGVGTIGELARLPEEELARRFGEWGRDLWRKARGLDDGPVEESGEVKSIGHEHTFEEDTEEADLLLRTLMRLCEKTARRMRKAGLRGRTVTTKVRFEDFSTLTRQQTLERSVAEASELYAEALENFRLAVPALRKVRLVGVSVSGLFEADREPSASVQVPLFEHGGPLPGEEVSRRIARAEDAVKDRFGEDAIQRGASLGPRSETEEQD
ncbi:MAG: DNA polymerase IV [Planctomycetota bacterium]|jgi:nucleotidyltransferase/DNA polymerase involved in DNA repair